MPFYIMPYYYNDYLVFIYLNDNGDILLEIQSQIDTFTEIEERNKKSNNNNIAINVSFGCPEWIQFYF